ncbi:hypothetical protein GCM10011409_31740 [Lentibacillus populi]|uniref:Uncharacterized protein n=2 Tax=Bacillales TaxID=1385 RepID=A0A9W5U0N9_9BACI|nr:hypothetical protein GCM10011409_31740 [Lentibacillus populi]
MLQLTWNQSEFFYMYIKKIWFMIKNPDCVWNMHVEFNGGFDENTFTKIDEVFNDQIGDMKQIKLSNQRKLYRLGTLNFEINIDESNNKIILSLNDLEVSFRRSRKIIDQELGCLLETLSKTLKDDRSEYFFNINFKDFNPYFGFFIRRLNAKEINTFNVKFNVQNDRVTINKKSIQVYTTSLQKLNSFSKEYLTLSPR